LLAMRDFGKCNFHLQQLVTTELSNLALPESRYLKEVNNRSSESLELKPRLLIGEKHKSN
jgi:hypothetical protein